MIKPGRHFTILMADDDEDDRELARDAVPAGPVADQMQFVVDGQDLIDYLRREGDYSADPPPRPSIILLDLNMPRKSGPEALAEIKTDEELRRIPVVVLTTSDDEEEIRRAYDLGANSFITKPFSHSGMEEVMKTVVEYWSEVAELPEAA
jgi:CheY-like chemotaxis protein